MLRTMQLLALTLSLIACGGGGSGGDNGGDSSGGTFALPAEYCDVVVVNDLSLVGLQFGDSIDASRSLPSDLVMGGNVIINANGDTQAGHFYIADSSDDFNGQGQLLIKRGTTDRTANFSIPLNADNCTLGSDSSLAKPANLTFGRYTNFESGHVRPLALTAAGDKLLVVNTPDARLEIFNVSGQQLTLADNVPVGLDPVAVALRNDNEAWVVNHLSDSISVVDLTGIPRVVRTLQVGDEPRDIVFAGTNNNRAFITTAHRGQNHSDFSESALTTPSIGRADVWVFDAISNSDSPISIVNLFSDTPRALAVSPDGGTVYAAAMFSGNQTTVLDQDVAGSSKAAPTQAQDGTPQPATGLIVKYNGSAWVDEQNTDWSNSVSFELPDYDVFAINATAATPTVSAQYSGVGTTLFNMAVNPVSGAIYISNTDARNEVRFEGTDPTFTTVRGHIAENQISVIKGGIVSKRHLNKHLDFSQAATNPVAPAEKAKTLSQPMQMAVTDNGQRLYVAAFGSNKVAWFTISELENDSFSPNASQQLTLDGGGPSGLLLNDDNTLLYVMTRFNNSIAVVQTSDHTVVSEVSLYNPEPAEVIAGRRFLYDADLTSDNGANSCGTCHVFGDMDALAWDLGDPGGTVVADQNPYSPGTKAIPGGPEEFHPLKGPMTTQTLRGLKGHGSQHWRGDRMGLNRVEVNGEMEEVAAAAFKEFNPAFVGLVGRSTQLSTSDMQAFTDFALTLVPPPNPIRALDNSLTVSQARARDAYFNQNLDSGAFSCHDCHVLTPTSGFFGTDGSSSKEGGRVSQNFKVPHERNLYQKVGRFDTSLSPGDPKPQQIRGFGFIHDGTVDTLDNFFNGAVFSFGSQQLVDDMESFMFAFDSNIAPIVGQQVTITSTNKTDTQSRIALLQERAAVTGIMEECDLVAAGVLGSEKVSFLYHNNDTYVSDKAGESIRTATQLLDEINETSEALTFTCVPPGSGQRMGLDRDSNGIYNRDD